jgi:cytochrome b6-f complex iron-sulfur subunit
MERKEFLAMLGVGAAALACEYCLPGCTNPNAGFNIMAPTNVDFTLDLTSASNAALKTVGGAVYNAGLIVAHASSGYVAVSVECTHQGVSVVFDGSSNTFICPAHGSQFALNGGVLRGPAGSPLASYKTTLTGSSLRVFS